MIKSAEIFGLNILSSIVKNKKCFLSFSIHFLNVFPRKAEAFSEEGEV